jgi:hypothetical protein
MKKEPRHVYVMMDKSGFIKIGVSNFIPARMVSVKTERQSEVSLVWATPKRSDAMDVESEAHKILLSKRTSGEWFDIDSKAAISAITESINRISNGDPFQRSRLPYANRVGPLKDHVLLMRVDADTKAAIERLAAADQRSISQWILLAVRAALKQETARGKG